jgi:glycosyltransferase involved in cell wall biosynthesis
MATPMDIKMHPRISVMIRTRDEEDHIRDLLRVLSIQTVEPSQLVIVDNFSHQEKLQEMKDLLLEAKKKLFRNEISIKLVPLARGDFSHPYATNLGLCYSENELVCITNGHSLPVSQTWIENGLTHFRDPWVVGVSGYFHPFSNASIWEKLHSLMWTKHEEATSTNSNDLYFSTINCLLRKSIWKEYPFDEKLSQIVPESGRYGGEDYDWGLEMVARGYKIVIEPKFDVYHSHGEGFLTFFPKHVAYRRLKASIGRLARPRESFARAPDPRNKVYEF